MATRGFSFSGQNTGITLGGVKDMTLKKIFEMAATNSKTYDAVLRAYKASNRALEGITRAGFVFNEDGSVYRASEVNLQATKNVEVAVKKILYLHSGISAMWNGRKTLDTINDKVEFLVEFNQAMLKTIAEANVKTA